MIRQLSLWRSGAQRRDMKRDEDNEVQLRFPAKTAYLSWVHWLFGRMAEEYGLDKIRKNRLLVVVTEAFTNAVIHGNRLDGNSHVVLTIALKEDEIVINVIDDGAGLRAIPPESAWAGADIERENGRGLELMRCLTDKLTLSETPGGGLTVTMHYRIVESPIDMRPTPTSRGLTKGWKGAAMELHAETSGGIDVIYVTGRLDLVGANALKDEIRRRLQDRQPQIILNLKQVDFINSSGLGALVSVLKDVRLVKGRLILSDLAPYVQEIFTITQLSNVFEIYATEEGARETFAQQAVTR